MAKSKAKKAADQVRLQRSIEAGKRKKHMAALIREIEEAAFRWCVITESFDGHAKRVEGQDGHHPNADGTVTLETTIDPSDPGNAETIGQLEKLFEASGVGPGGSLTFDPNGFELASEDNDDDVNELIEEDLFDEPLFDDALLALMPKLCERIGGDAFTFVADLLDEACTTVVTVRDGVYVDGDDQDPADVTPTTYVVDVMSIPLAGRAEAVRRVVDELTSGSALRNRMTACGLIGRGGSVAVLPGIVPLSHLHSIPFMAVRGALAAGCTAALAMGDTPSEMIAAAASMLGSSEVPRDTPDADTFSGAITFIRVVAEKEAEDDDLAYGEEAADAWLEGARSSFAAMGVELSTPVYLGSAGSEALQLMVERYFDAESRRLGIPAGRSADLTVVHRGMPTSVFMWHETESRLVGPLTVPLTILLADTDGFFDALSLLGAEEILEEDDPAAYDTLLCEHRSRHAAAEGLATRDP